MQAGCAGPPAETVAIIDPMGNESTTQFPCFEHQTLLDLLDSHGISWRYYAPSPGSIWTAPNAIQHLRCGSDWQNVIIPQSKVLTDIANGQLAQVTWVIPDGRASDHPRQNEGSGPSWVASVVNAIGNSAYWANTAILITWDDWGGWYDHVAPPILNSYEYGFRVPDRGVTVCEAGIRVAYHSRFRKRVAVYKGDLPFARLGIRGFASRRPLGLFRLHPIPHELSALRGQVRRELLSE